MLAGALFLHPIVGQFIDKDLYNALHKALITDDNLYTLQSLFYPPTAVQESSVQLVIRNSEFIVKKIEYNSDYMSAFYYDNNYDYYIRSNYSSSGGNNPYTCNNDFDLIEISAPENTQFLDRYLKKILPVTHALDISFFKLLFTLINDPSLRTVDEYDTKFNIKLSVDYLINMPTEYELITNLEAVLTWVRITLQRRTNYKLM